MFKTFSKTRKKISENVALRYEKSEKKKTLTPADKTSTMSRLNKNDYQNLLRNAITRTYKKADKKIETKINEEGTKFAKQADIIDNIEINSTGKSFVTLKDHKQTRP